MVPSMENKGFVYLRDNLNKSDYIGQQLLDFMTNWMTKPNDSTKISIIANILQYIQCTLSYQKILNVIIDIVSVSYSQPYKSQKTVKFCMQLLTFIIRLNESYPDLFSKHREILREKMRKPISEILSYIFDQQIQNADFSELNDKNWILDLAKYLLKYYGDLSSVESFVTTQLKRILTYIHGKYDYYVLQDFPSLFILSYCIEYHYESTKKVLQTLQNTNDNKSDTVENGLIILLLSLRLNPNITRSHGNTLQALQFNAILGILSDKTASINQDIARKVIQFAVDALDTAQSQIKANILECISSLLPFANLSTPNLKVLSDAAWYGMSPSITSYLCLLINA